MAWGADVIHRFTPRINRPGKLRERLLELPLPGIRHYKWSRVSITQESDMKSRVALLSRGFALTCERKRLNELENRLICRANVGVGPCLTKGADGQGCAGRLARLCGFNAISDGL